MPSDTIPFTLEHAWNDNRHYVCLIDYITSLRAKTGIYILEVVEMNVKKVTLANFNKRVPRGIQKIFLFWIIQKFLYFLLMDTPAPGS